MVVKPGPAKESGSPDHDPKKLGDAPIMVGLEYETAFVMVEGSGDLADQLVAFAGLDQADLDNYYLVANYIACLEKYGLLAQVVPAQQ